MNPEQETKSGNQAEKNELAKNMSTSSTQSSSKLAESEASPDKQFDDAPDPEAELFAWEASEYIEHNRNAMWYVIFTVVTILLAGGSVVLLREWLGGVVLILMAIAVLMFARRPPKTLKCSLQNSGINVGERFYPYVSFRSFSLVSDGALESLEFDPLKRFMPRLSVFFAPTDEAKVLSVLSSRLPQGDREQDVVDRLARKLKI